MNDRETRIAIKWAESTINTLHRNAVTINGSAIPHLEKLVEWAKVAITAEKIIDKMVDTLSKEVE